jgi:hypothetical protein
VAPAPAASTSEPEPDAEPQGAVEVDFDLDAVIEAWPLALETLKAPLRATIQDAHPIGMEHGTIVFGVPRKRYEAINQRFRSEASAIKDAFAQRLGSTPRFILRPHDFDAVDAFRPIDATRPSAPVEEPEDEAVDPNELVDARDVPVDAASRLVADFGAEVIEEVPRD